jgi:hypothetical protein
MLAQAIYESLVQGRIRRMELEEPPACQECGRSMILRPGWNRLGQYRSRFECPVCDLPSARIARAIRDGG